MTSATHQHEATLTRWNWASDRIEQWCSCGLQLADDYDEASYGPPPSITVGSYVPFEECGHAWLIDLSLGLGVFVFALLAALALILALA